MRCGGSSSARATPASPRGMCVRKPRATASSRATASRKMPPRRHVPRAHARAHAGGCACVGLRARLYGPHATAACVRGRASNRGAACAICFFYSSAHAHAGLCRVHTRARSTHARRLVGAYGPYVICVHTYTYAYIHICIRMFAGIYAFGYTYMHLYIHTHTYMPCTCIRMYACWQAQMNTHTQLCIGIYIHA